MNLYTSLTLRYLKENKRRTIVTIIGIILSTALICGIGNIWVGTANGLSKIDTKTDLITNYNMNDEEKSLSHYNIGDILITKSGDVLVGTSDGLNIYNEKKDEFYRIFNKDSDLSSQFIRSLAEDEN